MNNQINRTMYLSRYNIRISSSNKASKSKDNQNNATNNNSIDYLQFLMRISSSNTPNHPQNNGRNPQKQLNQLNFYINSRHHPLNYRNSRFYSFSNHCQIYLRFQKVQFFKAKSFSLQGIMTTSMIARNNRDLFIKSKGTYLQEDHLLRHHLLRPKRDCSLKQLTHSRKQKILQHSNSNSVPSFQNASSLLRLQAKPVAAVLRKKDCNKRRLNIKIHNIFLWNFRNNNKRSQNKNIINNILNSL